MSVVPSGIAKEATLSRRFGAAVKTWTNGGVPLTASATTLPLTGGKLFRLLWISALPRIDNTAGNLIVVRWHNQAGIEPLYCQEAISHWQMFDAPAADVPLDILLQNSQPVPVTIHYLEI